MAIINFMSNLLVAQPNGVWPKIIMMFNSQIVNYALAIMALTLVIKLLMFPIDFFNRKVTRKNSKIQAEIQPEIDVLKKKYGNDQKVLNEKTMALYKKHNYNVGGSCLITLIALALSMFIFFTLFSGLNKMSVYKIEQQYEDLRCAYYNVETIDKITQERVDEINADAAKSEEAKQRVLTEYQNTKESFLWIENVWIADSPFANPVQNFDKYAKAINMSDELKTDQAKAEYEKIYSIVDENTRDQNGYLVITILTVGLGVLQQWIANKKYSFKKKKKTDNVFKEPKTKSNILTMILMPVLLGFFAFMYNSVFGLYMIVGSVFSILTTPLINNILDVVEKKEEEKRKQKEKLTYSRKWKEK